MKKTSDALLILMVASSVLFRSAWAQMPAGGPPAIAARPSGASGSPQRTALLQSLVEVVWDALGLGTNGAAEAGFKGLKGLFPDLPQEYWTRLLSGQNGIAKAGMLKAFDEKFNDAELRDLYAFYKTSAGKKWLKFGSMLGARLKDAMKRPESRKLQQDYRDQLLLVGEIKSAAAPSGESASAAAPPPAPRPSGAAPGDSPKERPELIRRVLAEYDRQGASVLKERYDRLSAKHPKVAKEFWTGQARGYQAIFDGEERSLIDELCSNAELGAIVTFLGSAGAKLANLPVDSPSSGSGQAVDQLMAGFVASVASHYDGLCKGGAPASCYRQGMAEMMMAKEHDARDPHLLKATAALKTGCEKKNADSCFGLSDFDRQNGDTKGAELHLKLACVYGLKTACAPPAAHH